MVRVRKLVLAIAAASALSSGMAHALGLGDISLKSSLNQPLEAEIELLEVRDLGNGEVIPALAPAEEFSKVGVDRPFFLTDLKFTPVLKPNGKSVIRVTSSKPVREPYLNFLVEVLWPNGRLLREYTVLLDPPLYSPQTVAAAAPRLPVAAPAAPRAAAPAPVRTAQAPVPTSAAPAAVAAPTPRRIEGSEYRTDRDDTLWEVASRVRPSNAVSVHQTMLAIQDLNPNAFLDGNINRLKSGQVLRLPSEEQIRTRSQTDALAQVAAQNSAWREGRAVQPVAAARQLDATRRSEAGIAPAQTAAEDNLRLVSASSGKATAGSDNGAAGGSKALADKLAVNQESLATAQRENQELKERLTDLQSQLDKLQRLIELKNEQLAKLQGGLAADSAVPATAAVPAESQATESAAAPAPSAVPVESKAAEAAPADTSVAVSTPAAAAASEQNAQPAAAPVVAPAPVVEAPKPAAPKPAVVKPVPAPVYEPSLVDEVMANPLLLAAGGGALALLAGLGLMINSRRKSLKAAEADDSAREAELFQDLDPHAQSDLSPAGAPSPAAEAPKASPLKSDPLAEAEMYVTYGRFSHAAELLRNALNEEPQRADLRLKLMEVCAEMGDRDGFARQEAELGEIGGAQPQIDQLRARYPHMIAVAAAVAAGAAMGGAIDALDLDQVQEEVAQAATPSDEFAFDDLSLDSLERETAAPVEARQEAAQVAENDGFDLSLDDLEAELERELAANRDTSEALPLDELTLDGFGDDFASLEVDAQPLAASSADELDFDLELDALAGTAGQSAADDFSFDLDAPQLEAEVTPLATAPAEDDLLAELDQLSLDAPDAALSGQDDDFSFDLADVGLAAEPVSVAQAEAELAALPELDELEQELQAMGDASAAELDLDAAFDEFLAQADLAEPQADEPGSSPVVQATAAVVELPSLDEPDVEAAPVLTGNEDFNFLADTDETATKLDLARAYIDMGDAEGARDILDEVLKEGNATQQQEAREMMGRIA
ncbi:FimV/HubP family polar landmark protein [Pseudomonas oryzae]|uniref:Pilus assembly protein FimV n=1 Tax=Pseudomonas oryzae TaxID=1392877 RepID=A0A1H1LXL7_9PSED|nr:FimV/HubP family polar landmark protein [Pseudomonas oryzae]SDR78795.1 pilus assembly protein FimV [Pseudomonas oryzae]